MSILSRERNAEVWFLEVHFTKKTKNTNEKNIYIQSAKLNGKTLNGGFIRHRDVIDNRCSLSWDRNLQNRAANESV